MYGFWKVDGRDKLVKSTVACGSEEDARAKARSPAFWDEVRARVEKVGDDWAAVKI